MHPPRFGVQIGRLHHSGIVVCLRISTAFNVLEMRAVRPAMEDFVPPPGSHILVASDNSTVVAYVNRQGGTRSRVLWLETWDLV